MSLEAVIQYLRDELSVDALPPDRKSTHVHINAEKCIVCERLREALRLAELPETRPSPASLPPDYWESAE